MNHHHIIQKVFVEITVNSEKNAYYIKDDINSFLSIDVFPEIEKFINGMDTQLAGQTLQIPRLELNVNVSNSSLNTHLKDKITQLFKEELSEINKSKDVFSKEAKDHSKPRHVQNREKMAEAFIYFLENGLMPWWNSDRENNSFLEASVSEGIFSTPNFQRNVISILPKQYVQDRIINQLSDEQIIQLCLKILENKDLSVNLNTETVQDISKLNNGERSYFWRLVLQALTTYLYFSEAHLKEYLLEQILKEAPQGLSKKASSKSWKIAVGMFPSIKDDDIAEKSIEKSKNFKSKSHESTVNNPQDHQNSKIPPEITGIDHVNILDDRIVNEGQYVQNAGLILIHPFIRTFFEHCGLLDPETQKLTDPERCAHLLHYIATGRTNAPEYDMIFEKFLCNIPLHQSISRHIKLSRKHKTQAKIVIESVQHNWAPMKKSSSDLLQNEFFQRSGKLVVTDHDFTLTVERKTHDILLEKLAWGIGLVKLPWKEKFIFVNW